MTGLVVWRYLFSKANRHRGRVVRIMISLALSTLIMLTILSMMDSMQSARTDALKRVRSFPVTVTVSSRDEAESLISEYGQQATGFVYREDLGLTGVKEGCGEGECGACSVIKDGKLVTSCIIPVGAVNGSHIYTIEGIRDTEKGKCIIDAFAEGGAVQCGFCIPGMVMAAYALLESNPKPTELEIRKGISGNICRCTGYDLIVESIRLASEKGGSLWA